MYLQSKKDRSVKTALDARALNNSIRKDKYQMPHLDCLTEQIAGIINEPGDRKVCKSLVMAYAYSQTTLHPVTENHCNFRIVGGNATGTYRFSTRNYGLTFMPTEFQKMMDKVLQKLKNTLAS